MVYVVTDMPSFSKFMGSTLERDFKNKNPAADSRIRSSFTSFIHENKLHWSMCCKKRDYGHDLRFTAPATNASEKQTISNDLFVTKDLPRLKLPKGLLTVKQYHVLDLRSRGYSQLEVAHLLSMSRASVSMLEKRARKQIERARQTMKVYELSQKRQHKVKIKTGTRVQQIPMNVLQEADRFQIHLQPSMVEILKMVGKEREDSLKDGRTIKEISFAFNERGKLSLL